MLELSFPLAQRAFESFVDLGQDNTRRLELGCIQHAVRARGFNGEAHEFVFIGEETKFLPAHAAGADQVHDFARRGIPRIGDVVGAEGNAILPAPERRAAELVQLRKRVHRVEQPRVVHHLGQIVARVIQLVEGKAQPPDETGLRSGKHFFPQRLGAAIETAVVRPEGKVRRVILREPATTGRRAGVDAAAGDMAPWRAGFPAGLAQPTRQHGIGKEAVCLVVLAGVHVGLAGVAGGIDQELRLCIGQQIGQAPRVGIIDFLARQIPKGNPQPGKESLVSAANVT